jgi:type IX secretion system PorP/SprF family membrane protein
MVIPFIKQDSLCSSIKPELFVKAACGARCFFCKLTTYIPFDLNYANLKKLLLLSVFSLIGITGANAQQNLIKYTQFADNLTPFNQAYSMLDKAGSVSSLVSRQFIDIQNGAPTALMLNLNVPFENVNASGGLVIKNNSEGPETLTEINAFFAKSIQLTSNQFLAVSLNVGFRKYVFEDPDPTDPEFTDVRQTDPNLGFGIMLYSDNYYLGLSVPELTIRSLGNAAAVSQVELENHYYFSGAYLAPLDEDFQLKPAVLVAYAKGASAVMAASATLYIQNVLGLGASYNTDKHVGGILSVNLDRFKVGYSYQVGTASGNFSAANSATHEVTLSYRFGKGSGEPKFL